LTRPRLVTIKTAGSNSIPTFERFERTVRISAFGRTI
jgi:hypothetical protein